ncbi:MAG: ATP-binding protein [Leptospiraceae bacterium]|nr:ATP-binding protein [Leptospiraceae bacterium]MCP5510428.1 ATP-binding protein [Leptospiraceae bacterium]
MENELIKYSLVIQTFEDILLARRKARDFMEEYHFTTLDQTKFITALSELLRNVIIHAKEGSMHLNVFKESGKCGIKCTISDHGPGINDINLAMKEGYSTVGSLGLGLGGAKNLSDAFNITSGATGTKIEILKWQ